VFHYLIEKAEVPRLGAPVVRCWWHRHEKLQAFFKEAYRYGLGDGEAGIRGKDVLLIGGRMVLEAGCLVLGMVGLVPGVPGAPWAGALPRLPAETAGNEAGEVSDGTVGRAYLSAPCLCLWSGKTMKKDPAAPGRPLAAEVGPMRESVPTLNAHAPSLSL
jgi:hypothetical protein